MSCGNNIMRAVDGCMRAMRTGLMSVLMALGSAGALAAPDLSISNLTIGTIVARQGGGWDIPVTFTVTNIGVDTAPSGWRDMGYLSADGVLDNADQPQSYNGSYLYYRGTSLAPGASYVVNGTFATTSSTAPGTYSLFVKADGHSAVYPGGGATNTNNGNVAESDETNNVTSAPVTLALPDLSIGPVTTGAIVARQDGSWVIPVTFTVTNVGTAAAQSTWRDMAYLSADGVLDNADQAQSNGGYFLNYAGTTLAPGGSYTVNSSFTTLPSTAPGTYTLFVKADGRSAVYNGGGATNTDNGALVEVSEANNVTSTQVRLDRPDLSIGPVTTGAIVTRQDGSWVIPVTFTVTNVGAAAAQPYWRDMGYLSADGILDNADQAQSNSNYFFNQRSTALAPGDSYTVNSSFTTLPSTVPGTYTLFVKADGMSAVYNGGGATNTNNGVVVEVNEANNVASTQVRLDRPDLSMGPVTIGTVAIRQDGSSEIPVTFTVTNVGAATALPSWRDMGYLSTDGILDNADVPQSIGNYYFYQRSTNLAPGESYTVNSSYVTTASVMPGTYTLFVKADGMSAVYNGGGSTNTNNGVLVEADETNNTSSAQVRIDRPNLVISGLTLGTLAYNTNASWSIPVSFTVTNTGGANALPTWYDMGYLSTDGTLSNDDQSTSTYLNRRTTALAPGASYSVNATFVTSNTTAPGTYTFFVKADGRSANYPGGTTNTDNGAVGETSETDNVAFVVVELTTQLSTTTTLSTSVNPTVVGQGTTLTASVTPSAATGMITFKDGSTVLGTSALTSGSATLAASFGAPTSRSLTAVYSSDPNYRASTSATVVQIVNKSSTTTTLSVSPGTVAPDEPVEMEVTVAGASPTGTLVFKDGATTIGTRALSNGTAVLALSFGSTGTRSLSVSFPGDANNNASVSQVVTLNVQGSTGSLQPGQLTWEYGYDANGNERFAIDPNGNRSDRVFDALNNLMTETQPVPGAGIPRPVIGFVNDRLGQLTSVTDPRSLTTTYTIDGLGNTQTVASPDSGATTATYDAAGNVLTRTDARGKVTTYTYDALNRVTGIGYPTGTATAFEYDGGSTPVPASLGKLTKITDESGTTAYTHDAFGRVATKTQVSGTKTFAIGYEWGSGGSANDKLTAITYASGARVNYVYDTAGRVSGITLNPVNANGSGTNTGSSLAVLNNLAYTGANQPKAWTWGDAIAVQRGFDTFGRLLSYPLGNPSGTGAAAGTVRTVIYDNAARITGFSHAGAASLDQTFAYDGVDRLTDAITAGTFNGYVYDATGNRTQRKIGAQTYTNAVSPTSNRLVSVQDAGGTATVSSDAAGNITADAVGSYSYSDRGRLASATLAGGVVQYRYNALELRVSKAGPAGLVSGGASYYAYDEVGRLLGEYDADGVPRYETIYLGDQPVAVVTQSRSGTPTTVQTAIAFIYSDHLDTPRVIARTGDHAIVWRWDQAEAFGATPANDNPNGFGSFAFNQRFPGQVFDSETGLNQNWNREYNARQGRYIQSDPIGLMGGINTYAYVGGNPASRVDPSGLITICVNGVCTNTSPPLYDPRTDGFTPAPPSWGFPSLPEWMKPSPTYAKPPENAYDPLGPKAPGKPGKSEGFKDPKGGENWVRNPNGRGYGWQGADGGVWCPTGPDSGSTGDAHGGPHWDVQYPGGRYDNVYPGGRRR